MENVGFYATFDKYGVEVLILAFAVCACVAAAKKLFPKMNKRAELALRFVLSVAFYALYVTLLQKDIIMCLEKGASICGVSYFVRSVFTGEEGDGIIDAAIPKAKLTKKQLKTIKSKETLEEIKTALQEAANGRIPETKLIALATAVYEIKHRTEKV